MRRNPTAALLTIAAAVPALLAIPVIGAGPAQAHPVEPRVQTITLHGVDPGALSELRLAVPHGTAAGTLAGTVAPVVLTGRLATRPFDLVAVGWKHGTASSGTAVSVRVRQGGAWSGWQPLEQDGDGPDPGSPDAVHVASVAAPDVTAPLMTAGADGVQVRVDGTGRTPAGLTVDLVDGGRSADDAPSTPGGGPAASASAATGMPGIVRRAQWGADESLVKAAPVLNRSVKALIVHHTDTTNAYTQAQAYAQVRSLYAFHTKVRGWNDVGYNFIVDRFGRVYEGRRGSIGSAVMGAHAGGFNSETLGVAVLGTFSDTAAPAAVGRALVPLLAWKAAQYGINPAGRATLTSAGGSYTKYRAGARVPVYGISGHRDVDQTECPGNSLYPALPGIRVRAAALMVPGLGTPALTTPPVTTIGGDALIFSATVSTTQRWWATIGRLCGGAVVRNLSGTTDTRIQASWDLRDNTGRLVPPGGYTVSVVTSSPVGAVPVWTGDVEVLATEPWLAGTVVQQAPVSRIPASVVSPSSAPSATPAPADSTGCAVQRVAGTDPALSSVLAGRASHPDAQTVVLANGAPGEPIGQALAAAPLAAAQRAPLLLTDAAALPAVVVQDITARHVTTAYLVGSSQVISPAVEAQLRGLGVTGVIRTAGTDRWSTAAAVAAELGAATHQAVLASGDQGELLDTLVAASSAAAAGRPVLLTSRTGVPAATLAAIRAQHITSLVVVGSTAAVPDATLAAVRAAGVTTLTRVVGVDRWTSAVSITTALAPASSLGSVVLASGLEAAADLLVGSAQGRPVLLAGADALPASTTAWLATHRPASVWLIARPEAVTTPVLRAAQTALTR